jgi:hypothetical protein
MLNRLDTHKTPLDGSSGQARAALPHDTADTAPARIRGGGMRRHIRPMLAAATILLLGMVLSLGATAMPSSPRITLEVRNGPSNGSDGYTDTIASNGATYSYRYSGGEGKGGDVIFTTRGRVTVNVHLAGNASYTIDEVGFTGDTNEQLSWVSNPNASRVAVIQNENSVVQTANYKITVMDGADGTTIPCDPKIINR